MDDIKSSIITEDGFIKYSDVKPRDPFALESIRDNFARLDKDLAFRGLHWERIVVAGRIHTWSGFPPPHPTDPIIACMALGLKDGQEPSKEQIFILDHYLRQCVNALDAFQRDGSLPTEELRSYFEKEQAKQKSHFPGLAKESTQGIAVSNSLISRTSL